MKDENKTKDQLIDELAELRQRIAELETSEIALKRAEEKIEHLNLVLRAIRRGNQLIAKEMDRDTLLKGVCGSLIETRGYHNAWIALLDESGGLMTTAEAGLGKEFLPMVERLKRGELTDCGGRALAQSDVVVIEDPLSTCADCPLAEKYYGRGAMTVRLEHGGKAYGLLTVSIPKDLAAHEEEQTLFKEVAGDIAFALHNIELEEERKRAEEELIRLSNAVKMSTDSIVISDIEAKIIEVNEATLKMYGTDDKGELIGKSSFELIAPEERERALAGMKEAMERGYLKRREYHIVTKDNSKIPVEMSVAVMKDANGTPIGFVGVSRDITERKRAEEALQESEERYRNVFETAPDGIVTVDLKGIVTSCNSAFTDITGFSKTEIVDKHFSKLPTLRARDIPKYVRLFNSLIRGKVPRPFEARWLHMDGTIHWTEVHANLMKKGRKIIGFQSILRDITERKRTEEEIHQRSEELAALNAIAEAVSGSLDLREVLHRALDKVLEITGFEAGGFGFVDEAREVIVPMVHRGAPQDFLATFAQPKAGDGLRWQSVKSGEAIFFENLPHDPRIRGREALIKGFRAGAYLPLKVKDKSIGFMALGTGHDHHFTPEEKSLLMTIASQIAIAIENARLFEGERRRAAHLAVINEVSRKAISILNLDEMLEDVARSICRGFDYHNVALFLVDKERHEAVMEAVAGGFEHYAPGEYRQSLDQGILGWVIRTERSWLANDVSQDPYYIKGFLEEVSTESELCVPIKLGGEVIGALDIQSINLNAFDETDVTAMETLSGQIAIAIQNAGAYERLKTQNLEIISALATAVEAKDPYTSGHSEKVTQFAIAIAKKMGLTNDEIEDLRVAGLLHDIGKIGIPDSVLNKPARLTSAEFLMIKAHPVIAAEIVGKIKALAHLVPIIRHHHERYDGTGYPDGFKGEDIPLLARILSVADGFEAMTSERPYRRARTEEEALTELQKGAGTQWDPKVVEVFVKVYKDGIIS